MNGGIVSHARTEGGADAADSASPIPLIFSGETLVAVDKPPGITVIPASGEPVERSLRGRLEHQLGYRLWVVHRLDRDASGIVVFARNADAHRELSLAFEHRHVHKTYLAFTAGAPTPPVGRITLTLHSARHSKARPAALGEPGARDAATGYAVRRQWRVTEHGIAMVEACPETGRHHQIRVHLRTIGTPILFDALYGRRHAPPELADAPCQRLAPHALGLTLPQPGTREILTLDAPLAEDLATLVTWLDGRCLPSP
jgi:RluA family pseudouridine synthase